MKLTKKQELEVMQVYDAWMNSYLNGDVKTYDSFLDDGYRFIGSTDNEEFLNRKDTTQFFKDTAEQFSGKTDLRKQTTTIEAFDDLIFITHLFDAWFINGSDWTYYGRFRFSSVLQEKKEGWKFIYQHFSIADSKTDEGESIGFDKVNEENQELREAIKRRTVELEAKNRELEIEGALGRIRAQATAMKESSELLDIVVAIRNEFTRLGHEAGYFWHMMWLPEKYEKAMTSGDGTRIGFVMELPRHIHGDIPLLAKWEKSKKPTVVYAMNTEEAIDYVDKMVALGDFQNIDPQAPTHDDIRHIGGLTFIMARTTHGEIGYSLPGVVKDPPKDDLNILERFARAFDLAHRRFLDLQKAEKQAREVQIELALEKVRSRTMGMQRSDELRDTAMLLFQQVEELGINSFACGFNIWDDDKKAATAWMASKDRLQPPFKTNSAEDVYLLFHEAEKRGEPLFILEQKGKELEDHYKYLKTIPEVKKLSEAGLSFPTFQIIHCAYFSKGYLMFITLEPVPEAHDIFKRFAKVFEQTYTRFLDLEKAEAQAREAQIETAIERVRARTMAMQHSDELQETSFLLDQQVRALGIKTWGCAFNIYGENESTEWFGNEAGVLPTYTVPRTGIFKKYYQKGQKGESLHIEEFSGDECVSHYEYMSSLPVIGKVLKKLKATNKGFPTYQIDHVVYFKYGYLLFITKEDVPSAHDVFKRFAKVFEQTYTRFLDLQKAEAQAKEAKIETALERVRASGMAMHKSEELKDVVKEIFDQMAQLKINADHAGIVVDYEPKKDFHFWVADNQDIPARITVPYLDLPWDRKYTEAKKKGKDFFIMQLNFEEKNSFYKKLLPHIEDLTKEAEDFYLNCPGLAASTVIQQDIGLYIENFNGISFSDEENAILMRFGKVFQQTYTRFLDLQKAEAQAKEAQIEAALEKVRSASLAMHKSDEMQLVADTIYEQLKNLNFEMHAVAMSGVMNPKEGYEVWAGGVGTDKPLKIPFSEKTKVQRDYNDVLIKRTELFSKTYKGNSKKAYINFLLNTNHFPAFLEKLMIDSQAFSTTLATRKNSGIQILRYTAQPYTESENTILKRFAKVFEQAYIRFLDLQKAEAQAKEAQIENALEKVRSRSLAMHKSEDLREVVHEVHEKFQELDISMESRVAVIVVFDEDSKNYNQWIASTDFSDMYISTPYFKHRVLDDFWKAKHEGVDFYSRDYSEDEKNSYFKSFFEISNYNRTAEVEMQAEWVYDQKFYAYSPAFQKNSSVGIADFSGISLTEGEIEIIKRFSKVFEQAYIRFLDLEKAEAQAREAQIEAALEKVRSRTMAMQKGEEVKDVVVLLYKELIKLGVTNFVTCGYVEINETSKRQATWVTNPGGDSLGLFHLPLTGDATFDKRYKAWKEQQVVFHQSVAGKIRKKHLEYAITTFNSKEAEEMILQQFPDPTVFYCFNFSHGYLHLVAGAHMTKDEETLLARFTKVFEQTYTRFLDLEKAEAQAREAQIENALEKVRSRSLAMHKPDELQEVITVVAEKLKELGVIFDVGGVILCTYFPNNKDVVHWIASPDLSSSQSYLVPYFDNPIFNESWDSKNRGDAYFSKEFPVEAKNHFFEYAFENSDYRHFPDDYKQHVLEAEKHALSAAWSKNSAILIPTLTGVVPSDNDADIIKRFAKVFEQAYIRFMDLQKAEAQARESQIEVALEKVRSRTMAMHKSEELAETALVLYEQFSVLGNIPDRMSIGIFKEETKEIELWGTDQSGSQLNQRFTGSWKQSSVMTNLYKAWKSGNDSFVADLSGQKLNAWLKYIREEMKLFVDDSHTMGRRVQQAAFFSHGMLLFTTNEPIADEIMQLLIRFARVFSQTYTRFLDLQKAEAQAREAQIENALEKVRSRTMAMQKSEELPEAANDLFLQVQALGIPAWSAGYCIWETEDKKAASCNMSSEGEIQKSFILPTIGEGYNFYDPLQKGETFYVEELAGDALIKHYNFMRTLPMVGEILDELINAGISLPTFQIFHIVYFPQGYLMFITYEQVPDAHEIFKRFANVFEQTYTRFLDLKKAEAQGREAQIEGALERVRSKTMAMHNSKDLEDIVISLFDEVLNLGLDKSIRCGIGILEGHEGMETRSVNSNSDGSVDLRVGMLNMRIHPMLVGLKKAWKKGSKGYSYEYKGKDVRKYYEALNNEPEYPFNANLDTIPEREFHRSFFFSSGIIFTFSETPISEESSRILARFAAVFGQTYRRFLDLQKAEAQAREAIKQASLDRVRGQIASMRSTADLNRITPLVWNELTTMGVPFIRCGVFIIDESTQIVQVYLSAPDGHSLGVLHLKFNADPLTKNTVAHWRKGSILKEHWNREEFISWTQSLMKQGQISDKNTYQGAANPPESLDLHFIPFTQGMLYVGDENPLNDEQIDLVHSLADAFAIAYARYEDFTKLEKAKQSVETTLSELKATQNQLVQSEKMASLGELTAGIAHEIQNPLNFVNNFSEVSVELIEEMHEELEKGDLEEAIAISEDVKQNLQKINHHGKRADGIVKGMLQHSRSSSGQKEPTDINALADEYLRLAYHGLRAKEKSFNATLETDYDDEIGKIEIIPQDIGRVILNLITNAFYVVKEKKEKNSNGYEPTVAVSTKKKGNMVFVSVKDNGNGIPKEVLDKIFQPFFTTKPTGKGTGLGLSMSYDIVTKGHGGELKVETKEGKETTFTIVLPIG